MRILKVMASCLVLGALAAPTLAQDGPKSPPADGRPERPDRGGPGGPGGRGPGGGPQLSAEASKAAWELEAKGVASSLKLDDEKTAALVKAYGEARESHNAASEKLRKEMMDNAGGGGPDGGPRGGPEMREKMEKLGSTEREKLSKALSSQLTGEQLKKAMEPLGTFNRSWDNMVDTVAGFKLEEKKQADALAAIQTYVVGTAKARAAAADGDRDAMRAAMQEFRDNLTASLKKSMSEEQVAKVEAAMGRGRGGPGGPGGGGGGRPVSQ